MTRVLHLLDGSCDWQQVVAVQQLIARRDGARPDALVAGIGPTPPSWPEGHPFDRFPGGKSRLSLTAVARFDRYVRDRAIDVVCTWGPVALLTAATLRSRRPLLTVVFDPGIADAHVRKIRTVGDDPGVVVICAAQRVRRRLVERGVPLDACVVVRPAVDFALIRDTDRAGIRAELGVPDGARLLVLPPLIAGSDGHGAALWGVLMRAYLEESIRLVVPGSGGEITHLRRLAAVSEHAGCVIYPQDRIPFERLCIAADDLVIGDVGEIPMTAAAWAMAAGTLITAPATYATTEILANDLNARLFKAPENWRNRAARLAARLDPASQAAKIREVARGQAYEVFSRRRFVRQFEQVVENLLGRQPPAAGITDPALIGAV